MKPAATQSCTRYEPALDVFPSSQAVHADLSAFEYVLAGHSVQPAAAAAPAVRAKPWLHATQALEPELNSVPAPHATQAVCAALLTVELVLQSVQEVWPVLEVTVFDVQSVHVLEFSDLPASQLTHWVAAESTGVPAAFLASFPEPQVVEQLDCPAELMVFSPQGLHEEDMTSPAKVPATQGLHVPVPPVDCWNFPGTQLVQEDCPSALLALPRAQATHVEAEFAPTAADDVPAAQGVHEDESVEVE